MVVGIMVAAVDVTGLAIRAASAGEDTEARAYGTEIFDLDLFKSNCADRND